MTLLDNDSLAFIAAVAAHLDGWTLQTDEQGFSQSRRATIVNDISPGAVIIAAPPGWQKPDHWSFHADTPMVSRSHVWIPDPPKSINVSSWRRSEVIAREIQRRLAPQVLSYARDVAARVAEHEERVAASDAALEEIADLVPGIRVTTGSLGTASLYQRVGEWETISADFRVADRKVTLEGLSPAQQVVIAKALASVLADLPAYEPGR